MARLGLAFCCLWVVVYVHAAPGYGGRDSNQGGSSTDPEKRKIISLAHPIAQINDEDTKHAGYGAGSTGDKIAGNGNVNYGDKSESSGDGSDKKDSDGSGDSRDHSSNGNSRDSVEGGQSGAGNEHVNHNNGPDYTNGEGSSSVGENSKNDDGEVNGDDVFGKNNGQDGVPVHDSSVKGNDPSSLGDKGDTDRLNIGRREIIKKEQGGGGDNTSDNKSSEINAGSSYQGGNSDKKDKNEGDIASTAGYIGVSGGTKDFGDNKEDTSGNLGHESGTGGYQSNTGSKKSEERSSDDEKVNPSLLSKEDKKNAEKVDEKPNQGTEKDAGDYHGGISKEKDGKVLTGVEKTQGGVGDGPNANAHRNEGGKKTEEANNYGTDLGNGGSGNHEGISEVQDRLLRFSDQKVRYGR